MSNLINPLADPRCIVVQGNISDDHGIWCGGPTPADLRRKLDQCQHPSPIIAIHTDGGSHDASLVMWEMLKLDPRPIIGVGRRVLSAGVLVFGACDKRLMLPDGVLTFHGPVMPFGAAGFTQAEIDAAMAKVRDETRCHVHLSWPHLDVDDIREWIDTTRSFTAQEALEAGLIDGITSMAGEFLGTTYAVKESCGEWPYFPIPDDVGACTCAVPQDESACCVETSLPQDITLSRSSPAESGVFRNTTVGSGNRTWGQISGTFTGQTTPWTIGCVDGVWAIGRFIDGANITMDLVSCDPFELTEGTGEWSVTA